MYSALGQTWHAMRIFGGDRTFYAFVVQGKGGHVFERWEVPVPFEKLATNYLAMALDHIRFAQHGRIVWSDDSKRVSFQVNGIEVSGFDTETGRPSGQAFATAPHAATNSNSAPVLPAFGPVIERGLNNSGEKNGIHGIDLESSRLFSAAATSLPDLDSQKRWFAEHGVDLIAANKGGSKWQFGGFQTRLAPCAGQQWDSASAETIHQLLASARMETQQGWQYLTVRGDADVPLTFVFQTGGGNTGLLQITGFATNPRGVNLRYKLVQRPGSRPVAGESRSTNTNVPGADFLKPIPPEAAVLLVRLKALPESPAYTGKLDDTNAMQALTRELSGLSMQIKDLLRGTAAWPLIERQDELIRRVRNAVENHDQDAAREPMEQIKQLGEQVEQMIESAVPPVAPPSP